MSSTHNLRVFHRAVAIAGAVTALAQRLPRQAFPGMRAQLVRAAASIPANIAEGNGQATAAQYAHYVSIALGSCAEVESHLLLVAQVVPSERDASALAVEAVELQRMLGGLRKYLRVRARAEVGPRR
ncbi:MAG: four helix bundle protein [Gemmatimonadetes bacterium]|nr:four helix bundle protein [Gemmatimonadota bacterium]